MEWRDVATLTLGFLDANDLVGARAALKGALRADGEGRARRQEERQGDVLRDVAQGRAAYRDESVPLPPAPPKSPSEAGKMGGDKRAALDRQRRLRALTDWSPQALLYLPNEVALFLRDHPMWSAWTWEATQECNARLVHCVPQLYQDAPLPRDDRLALPLTVAGLTLWRVLDVIIGPLQHVGVQTRKDVLHAVYQQIREGMITLDRLEMHVYDMDLEEPFREDFVESLMAAEDLLLHFIHGGQESWRLIRKCGLGRDCLVGAPYYVTDPRVEPKPKDPHGPCRVARHHRGDT